MAEKIIESICESVKKHKRADLLLVQKFDFTDSRPRTDTPLRWKVFVFYNGNIMDDTDIRLIAESIVPAGQPITCINYAPIKLITGLFQTVDSGYWEIVLEKDQYLERTIQRTKTKEIIITRKERLSLDHKRILYKEITENPSVRSSEEVVEEHRIRAYIQIQVITDQVLADACTKTVRPGKKSATKPRTGREAEEKSRGNIK